MVVKFSGTLFLGNGLGVIGRVSINNLRGVSGPRAQCGPCGHGWQKVAQKNKI
jgi:hypothetical protein